MSHSVSRLSSAALLLFVLAPAALTTASIAAPFASKVAQPSFPSPMMRAGWRDGSRDGVPWIWSREAGAARLLDAARRSLATGQLMEARRRLEVLVGRYPDSAAADEARGELRNIYARDMSDRVAGGTASESLRGTADAAASTRARDVVPVSQGRAAPAATARNAASTSTDPVRDLAAASALSAKLRQSIGDRVFFSEGSAELGSRARALIGAQAQWLRRQASAGLLTVEAYADDRAGGEKYNQDIAAQRAEAVRARLIAEGIEPQRILTHVFGRQRPVATCPEAECAAQNRRVVVVPGPATNQAMLEPDLASAYVVPRPGLQPLRRTGN